MDLYNIYIFLGGAFGIALIIIIAQQQFFRKWKVSDAAESFLEKNYLKSRNILEKIIMNEPRNSLAYWYAGRASILLGQVNRGISELKKVIQINKYDIKNPSIPELGDFSEIGVHKYLREIYQRTRQENAEFQENQILMKLEPENPEYPMEIAKALIKNKEYSERTENYLSIAANLDPENAEVYSLLALVNLKNENLKKAKGYSEKALSINPNHIDSKYVLGEALYHEKQYNEALEVLNRGILSDHYKKSALLVTAKTYFQKEDYQNALESVKRADEASISIYENPILQWDALYLMAKIMENINNPNKAKELYSHIFKYQPDYKDVKIKVEQFGGNELEYVKDYITAKVDQFQEITESMMNLIGYKVSKIENMDDGNINLDLTKEERRYIAFIRRTIDLISDDVIKRLIKIIEAGGYYGGVIVTTGDFTSSSRNLALKSNIQTMNGSDIEPFIEKIVSESK